jgi:hypothetical protein
MYTRIKCQKFISTFQFHFQITIAKELVAAGNPRAHLALMFLVLVGLAGLVLLVVVPVGVLEGLPNIAVAGHLARLFTCATWDLKVRRVRGRHLKQSKKKHQSELTIRKKCTCNKAGTEQWPGYFVFTEVYNKI